ncbi:MAG TPA: alpha-glucan family phosphorylase [Acidimicrobiia bacterium]|nr:alpha-glucan family phosphorylase [Acidimicrobiia bacterium]
MLPEINVLNHVDYPIPRSLDRVVDLANNMWWAWNTAGSDLWSALDADQWEQTHNPLDIIRSLEPHRWLELEQIETVQERYADAVRLFDEYMESENTWFLGNGSPVDGAIAYLCTEYGIHNSLPLYSGGLGILAGDHVKSASDLGLPLVAVGLFYRRGYFRQEVDADGDQQHISPVLDHQRMPIRPVASPTGGQLKVTVELPGRSLSVAVWRLAVGRVSLLLLDTDITDNDPSDRPVTHTLYVRGREMRFIQELVLGAGGVRALAALGIEPSVWHVNEGHAALAVVERVGEHTDTGMDLDSASALVKSRTAFTLHTPVPAGNETFERWIADKYLGPWAERLGLDLDGLAGLAQAHDPGHFDMGALAIRFARVINGVSQRHGEIVTRDWAWLIGHDASSVTNGVHTPTWIGRSAGRILRSQIGSRWASDLLEQPERMEEVAALPAKTIWETHTRSKESLARFAHSRLRRQFARHGAAPDELRAVDRLFSPDVLTLGFARRFATYKRATLMFRDVNRLALILANPARPIQVVFAGKAHPADDNGQALIRHLVELSRIPELRGHLFVLEDYDARMARFLVQGCDVWVNNPRPPNEASGTSGMKAAMNGVLNLSVLDGWWAEGYEGDNGWAFGWKDPNDDLEAADAHDADDFYRILADEVAPMYYDRDDDGIPQEWVERMRRSIMSSLVRFSSHRMVADYVDLAYGPLSTVE